MLLAVKHGENKSGSPEEPITDVILVAQSPFLFDNPEDALLEFSMFPKPKDILKNGKVDYFLRVRIAEVDYESFPASIAAEFVVQTTDANPNFQPLLVFPDWMIDRPESGLSEATTVPAEETI
jgi:hypothetical protein